MNIYNDKLIVDEYRRVFINILFRFSPRNELGISYGKLVIMCVHRKLGFVERGPIFGTKLKNSHSHFVVEILLN